MPAKVAGGDGGGPRTLQQLNEGLEEGIVTTAMTIMFSTRSHEIHEVCQRANLSSLVKRMMRDRPPLWQSAYVDSFIPC